MADDKPQNADFIGRVVSDAKNPPETRMLTGWFGDSSEEGHRRLYSDAELHCYADIPDDAILYSEPVRDSQPSGCVMVWIKRDADVKQGGSAASRAARFLQGQVQQDFASAGAAGSLDKAGLRCVTQVPCGEPTGFTGQCTKQPDVGGAWPCITAIPHCYEVTGFTGKCTHQPWPNPTRYIGCTILHCPTHDLTHIPHICNIVATGQPGCVVVNPPQGGDPAEKVAEVDEKEAPATSIPGCGYTKTWGVCDTHLLGCGKGAQDDAALITSICAPTAFCHVSQNCGGAPGADTWTTFCTRAHPPVCYPTEACHTQPPQCGAANFAAAAPGAAAAQPASAICATAIGCDITVLCPTRFRPFCFPTPFCPTLPQQCFPIPSPFCPVTQACPFGTGGGGDPAQRFAAFNAAAPGAVIATAPVGCTVPPTSPHFGCTQSGIHCPTKPLTQCTQSGPQCPTSCGPDCQSQQPTCTSVGPACGHPNCATQAAAGCHTVDVGFECTQAGSSCQGTAACTPAAFAAAPHTIHHGCSFTGALCTFFGCPTSHFGCVTGPVCRPGADSTDFCPTSLGCGGVAQPQAFRAAQQPPSDFVACSQFGGCPTLPKGDCTFFGCPSLPQYAAAGPGGGCTQSGPQCPTHAKPQCTFFGPACPPTPGIICTQLAPCPTHQLPCHTPGFECTMFCTQGAPGCPPTINSPACVGPITGGGPQCPPASGFNCPSQVCQSIACQSAACQPGGGQQFARAFDQSTEFCPTSGGCGGAQAQAIGGFTHPTPATHCFVCPPFDAAAAAQAQPQARPFQTAFIQCINQPTPATHCFVCPPFDAAAAQRLAFPPNTFQLQCHPHSGLPIDCPFPSLFYVCTAVQCTVVCLLR